MAAVSGVSVGVVPCPYHVRPAVGVHWDQGPVITIWTTHTTLSYVSRSAILYWCCPWGYLSNWQIGSHRSPPLCWFCVWVVDGSTDSRLNRTPPSDRHLFILLLAVSESVIYFMTMRSLTSVPPSRLNARPGFPTRRYRLLDIKHLVRIDWTGVLRPRNIVNSFRRPSCSRLVQEGAT